MCGSPNPIPARLFLYIVFCQLSLAGERSHQDRNENLNRHQDQHQLTGQTPKGQSLLGSLAAQNNPPYSFVICVRSSWDPSPQAPPSQLSTIPLPFFVKEAEHPKEIGRIARGRYEAMGMVKDMDTHFSAHIRILAFACILVATCARQ
ncbi:uncharacterized protein LOC121529889 [Drosophila eugracilis]|uniref:uncharacterized protein LOC121529889 n=1 Tax=Drosophila eugracilis TaxID=29029 RepID=UPI001BDB3E8A|nr:uncharacterized protein LOC121529889 [Drosophila eugracilis]